MALALAGLGLGIGLSRWSFAAGAFRSIGRAAAAMFGLPPDSYAGELIGSFLTLLPATLMLGFVVPFVARIAGAVSNRFGRRFGFAYSLNTLGAVAGTLLAGLWGIPVLGSAGVMLALIAVCALASLVVATTCVPAPRRRQAIAAALLICIAGAAAGSGESPVRHGLLGRFAPAQVLLFDEGPVQTIAVVKEDNAQQLDFLRLITNQTSLTGTHPYARRYMRLLGHPPLLYARTPRRAPVTFPGTGLTAAAVPTHPPAEALAVAHHPPRARTRRARTGPAPASPPGGCARYRCSRRATTRWHRTRGQGCGSRTAGTCCRPRPARGT